MKFKTTKKEINNGYEFVISAGYCKLQYLLKWESPIAYTTRADGIVTGKQIGRAHV